MIADKLDVYDSGDTHLGDLVVTKTKLIWCKGQTRRENGKAVTWEKFMAWIDTQP